MIVALILGGLLVLCAVLIQRRAKTSFPAEARVLFMLAAVAAISGTVIFSIGLVLHIVSRLTI